MLPERLMFGPDTLNLSRVLDAKRYESLSGDEERAAGIPMKPIEDDEAGGDLPDECEDEGPFSRMSVRGCAPDLPDDEPDETF